MLPRTIPATLLLTMAIACGSGDVSPSQPSPSAPSVSSVSPRPQEAIPGLLGTYALTFTAAPGCSLPPEALTLTFAKAYVFERTPGSIKVELYTNYACWGCSPGFTGTRQGDSLSFVLVGADPEVGVVELVGNRYVRYDGTATVTMGDKTISGLFNGRISVVNSGNFDLLAECSAAEHRMEFK